MKLSILASLFLAGSALATGAPKMLEDNAPCKKDGSMGNCPSKICDQQPDQPQGTCKPAGGN